MLGILCRPRTKYIWVNTPYLINLYLLHLAKKRVKLAHAFVFKFYQVRDWKLFWQKYLCDHGNNRKEAFGSTEVRLLWNQIDKNGGLHKTSLGDLHTFVMTVFQHVSFCRFSDLSSLQQKDIMYEVDFFKIYIKYFKTDQAGGWSNCFYPWHWFCASGSSHDDVIIFI